MTLYHSLGHCNWNRPLRREEEEEFEITNLELQRRQVRLTQAALARQTGVHPLTVSQIESGRVRPSAGELERFAAALHFRGDPAYLAEEAPPDGEHAHADGYGATRQSA